MKIRKIELLINKNSHWNCRFDFLTTFKKMQISDSKLQIRIAIPADYFTSSNFLITPGSILDPIFGNYLKFKNKYRLYVTKKSFSEYSNRFNFIIYINFTYNKYIYQYLYRKVLFILFFSKTNFIQFSNVL